jgi:transcription initiation factor IIF auxiliary subunit
LHPVYKDSVIEVQEPPFLLSRTAYAEFIIDVEIQFKAWTELKPIRLDHLLDFGEGQTYSAVLSVCDYNNEVEDMHNASCVRAEFDKIQGHCAYKRRNFKEAVDELTMVKKAISNLLLPMDALTFSESQSTVNNFVPLNTMHQQHKSKLIEKIVQA